MNPTLPEILNIDAHLQTGPAEAVRTVLHSGANLNLVLWQIPPGAALPPHHHPTGADIWLILRGSGELIDDGPRPATAWWSAPARPTAFVIMAAKIVCCCR